MRKFLLALISITSFASFSQVELEDGLYAVVHTSKGDITISLEYQKVPMTVASFVGLAEGKIKYDTVKIKEPFFDGIIFHRVISDFMIQGGDPTGKGSGNPGYFFPDEFDSTLLHTGPGILSMANSGPNTNGSQFFITHKSTPWLNMKHAVFGSVISGQEVVDKIAQGDTIQTIEIVCVGKEAKKFKASKVFNKEMERIIEEKEAALKQRREAFQEKMGEKFPEAVQTESGLMYIELAEGEGQFPKAGDEIELHYTGYLEDESKFESSVDQGKPVKFVFKKQPILKGWDEALELMKPGSKMKIMVPSWLGFGEAGSGKVPPNTDLIFEIELIGLRDLAAELKKDGEEFKTEMKEKFPEAKQTESGLMYVIEEKGSAEKPKAGDKVEVHYTGTFVNGEKFDSSRDRDQPFVFPLGQGRVIKGWDEGIQLVGIGGKIKLIIPYWLGYGEKGNARIPGMSTLIFDVEVLGVK
ncbi:MAG: FKBP-type peptidyl-prolyl cis-trans isomerase [Crocinitomicaceae bacterium]